MQLFVDLDGVFADFDRHYEALIGPLPPKSSPERDVEWERMDDVQFFATIPLMPDARMLWEYVRPRSPIILTGVPKIGRERAAANKRAWVGRHLGYVQVITCPSKEKYLHAKPGDILIDDWEKYRHLWEAMGGIWITHVSAAQTIARLMSMRI